MTKYENMMLSCWGFLLGGERASLYKGFCGIFHAYGEFLEAIIS